MAPDGMQQGSGAMRSGMQPGGPMQPGPMQPGMMGDHTMDFVTKAAQSDEFEKSEGLLAERRSHNPHVKKFAAMMVSAHTKTTMGLKKAIAEGHVKTAVATKLDARRQGMIDNLRASSGAEFDKRYVAQQIAAHHETLDLMKGYAEHGHNDALKDAASKTAPLVKSHLEMAKALPGA